MRNLLLTIIILLTAGTGAEAKLRVAHRSKRPARTETTGELTAQPVDTTMRKMSTEAISGLYLIEQQMPRLTPSDHPLTILDSIMMSDDNAAPVVPAVIDAPTSAVSLSRDLEALTIKGFPEISPDLMAQFVQQRNPDFDPAIAHAFYTVGHRYGIRGDIALCQSILETGWFRFADGTAVSPDQHNYCGLGVTKGGMKGHSFNTIELGVTAQIQHLYAYATESPLPDGEQIVDPRFKLVKRGVAPTWRDLNRRWAMNDRYSRSIMDIFRQLITFHNQQCETTANLKE